MWTQVVFMEGPCDDAIWRYGTQYVINVGLNQPIRYEVLEKTMEPAESRKRAPRRIEFCKSVKRAKYCQ